MTKKNDQLTDDDNLEQSVQYLEKPKRGVSFWDRKVPMPTLVLAAVVVALVVIGVEWVIFNAAAPQVPALPATRTPVVEATAAALALSSPTPVGSCAAYPPTGARLAFVDYNAAVYQLTITDPVRATRCAVVPLPNNLTELDIAPNGERIAYTRQDADVSDLWLVDITGGDPVNITAQLGADVRSPAWSPDGTKIAFAGVDGESRFVYVIDAAAGTLSTMGAGSQPAWSPDGARIAFVNADGQIAVMNADGTNVRRVTNSDAGESFPNWSPDGARILFARQSGGALFTQIYTVNPDDPQMEHQFIADLPIGVTELAWLANDRFAYVGYGNLGLHSRLFPAEGGRVDDQIVIVNVNAFDWWTPPS